MQGQGQLEEALIQLSLTSSDIVVSREVVGHGRSVCVSKMLGFGPPLSLCHIVSGYFSVHIATLGSNSQGVPYVPNGKARTHTCLLQRQGGTAGFSIWFSLCRGLLPGVASNGKL